MSIEIILAKPTDIFENSFSTEYLLEIEASTKIAQHHFFKSNGEAARSLHLV